MRFKVSVSDPDTSPARTMFTYRRENAPCWRSSATDSDVPWLDALPTVGSLAGQFLLGRKWVENWPVWVAVNVVSVGLFAIKGLWLTVVLYAVFVLPSVAGWRAWSAQARAEAR